MSKTIKRLIWIIIIAAIVVAGVLYFRGKKPKVAYTTATAQTEKIIQTVSETGKINAVDQTDLSFKLSGRVIELTADVGDQVKQGQLLAQLDLGTLSSQLAGAREDLKYQKETLDSMKRRKSIYNIEDRDAQRSRIRSAQENVNGILSQIRDTKMYSPAEAVVLKRGVDVYETTVANSPSPVFTLGDPHNLEIDLNVPESDIGKVAVGQKAEVTFDALTPDDIFNLEVTNIDPASTVIQDVVYYQVKMKFTYDDPRIKPGMTANIDIHTAEKDNVLVIPMRAVILEGKDKYVNILVDEKNNITKKVKVATGLSGDEGMVEITSGLKAGDRVITFAKTQ